MPAIAQVAPTSRVLDMLGDWFDAGLDGGAGVDLPEPAPDLYFLRVRGLSPVFEYPGSLGP